MDAIVHKQDLEQKLGSTMMSETSERVELLNNWGRFSAQSHCYDGFVYNLRQYEDVNEGLTIPVSSNVPVMTMIFQFKGTSFYNDRHNPFALPYQHHSFNYFNRFECKSLVREKSSLYDMTFVLARDFYETVIGENGLSSSHLSDKILGGHDFNTISSGLPMQGGIREIVHNILTCPYSDGFRDTFIRAQLKALFILQFCQFHGRLTDRPFQSDNRLTNRDRDILNDVRKYLSESYLDDTSLEKLSRLFGINEFKLKYGFRKCFNTSPIRYVTEQRMAYAADLLRNTDQSVYEISTQIGYQHPNNFSMAFRKQYGMSPNTYRS